jgi:hypothetical protein
MVRRLSSSIFITGCLWALAYLSDSAQPTQTAAQVTKPSDLFSFQPTYQGTTASLARR